MNTKHMHMLLLAICCFSYVSSVALPYQQEAEIEGILNGNSLAELEKRAHNFLVQPRSYMYNGNSGVKRLPVYNFGLGKRNRIDFDDDNTGERSNEKYALDQVKRAAQRYGFGLGKRTRDEIDDDNAVERGNEKYFVDQGKRTAQRYGFGLGKR